MKISNSIIYLNDLTFYSYHGVMKQESDVGNTFKVSLKLVGDFEEAMRTDTLSATINYADVYELVKQEMAVKSSLLEHVTFRIAKSLNENFPQIKKCWVRVEKTTPPIKGFDGASVSFDSEFKFD